jgi:hypothetical protein
MISDKLLRKSYDLIFATTIFNYFSDAVAKVAASNLFQSLKKCGLLLIIFELPGVLEEEENENRAIAKKMVLRGEAEIEALLGFIGGRQVFVKSEPPGYLMLKIEK